LQAGEKKLGTDESVFNAVLCARNFAHLRAVFDKYKAAHGKTMEQVIESETSGTLKEGFLAIGELFIAVYDVVSDYVATPSE
jgi:annexin A7/11